MSGIVGVFNLDGEPVRPETLDTMCQAIEHRGPHGRGLWSEGSVGFGHVLLHTTEESLHEKQPLSLDGKTWITADARIDDRAGLIDLLNGHVHSGENLHEATDVCLLLHAYHAWGVDCVRHLTGVFAAVIWDSREHKLVCLRDQIGIKPFYYAHTPKRLVFASEVKGILASGLIPKRIYEPRIADFLVQQLEGIDKTCTFFEDVARLPPAHRIICSSKNMNLEQYWTLGPTGEIKFTNQQDYIEAFKEIFYKAVGAQLRGAKPVASMLSGGLDSSSIVAVARDILAKEKRPDLSVFSLVNNADPRCQETLHIKHVLAQGGLNAFSIDVSDSKSYLSEIIRYFQFTDDLFDQVVHSMQLIYIEAGKKHITAMLDGLDGDLVMGQPGNHIAYLLQQFQFTAAFREAKGSSEFYFRFPGNTYTYLYGGFRSAFAPEFLRFLKRKWRDLNQKNYFNQVIKDTLINPDFSSRINLADRLKTLQPLIARSHRIDLRREQVKSLTRPYLVAALERYDRVASRYSIEPRHPILDRRLIEYCLSLPCEIKNSGGWTKLIARKCMRGLLPEEVIWRKGFEHLGPQVTANLLLEKAVVKDFLINKIYDVIDYVNIAAAEQSLSKFLNSDKIERQSEAWKIIQVLALEKWLKNKKCMISFD